MWLGLVLLPLFEPQVDPASLAPLYRQALTQRERELGPRHEKTARAAADLGLFLLKIGDRQGAAAALRRALEADRANFPATHDRVAEDCENLALAVGPESAEGLVLLDQASAAGNPRVAARALSRLANIYEQAGRPEQAVAAYRKALAKEETATRLNDLALLIEPAAAEPLLRKALALRMRDDGPRHPETATVLANLGNVLLALGRPLEAEQRQRAALAAMEAAMGVGHPRVAIICANLAEALRARRMPAEAKANYRRALQINEAALGPDHPATLADRQALAEYLKELGEAK